MAMLPMSSSSSLVLIGRMMSARMVSFSSQGCWTTMVSILGLRKASYGLEAVVPAGGAAGVVHPDHVDLGAALFLGDGVGVLLELVFEAHEQDGAAHELSTAGRGWPGGPGSWG